MTSLYNQMLFRRFPMHRLLRTSCPAGSSTAPGTTYEQSHALKDHFAFQSVVFLHPSWTFSSQGSNLLEQSKWTPALDFNVAAQWGLVFRISLGFGISIYVDMRISQAKQESCSFVDEAFSSALCCLAIHFGLISRVCLPRILELLRLDAFDT